MDGIRWRWLEAGVDRARWTELLVRCPHDFHQLPAYVELEARRLTGDATALVLESPAGIALLPLVLRPLPDVLGLSGLDASSPYGYPAPVFSCQHFASSAVATIPLALRERGVVSAFVRLHPLLELPLDACAQHGTLVDHGPTVWIDLTADEQVQWADYRSTHRNLIRRAQRDGLRVRFDPEFAELDAFFPVYAQTMIRLGADWSEFGRAYLDELAVALEGRGFLALVEHDEQVIAGGVFTRCEGIVQYHLSGTATAWQRMSPSRLLLDEVRRHCAAHGDRRMHIGGGVGAQEDALFRFKRGFSSTRARFRSWRLVSDMLAYGRLVARWQELGGAASVAEQYFPRYRAPLDARAPLELS